MQRRSKNDKRFPPPELRQSSPRPVRLSANGYLVVALAVAMLGAAPWAGLTLYERAAQSAVGLLGSHPARSQQAQLRAAIPCGRRSLFPQC